jgi:hypothetical protein
LGAWLILKKKRRSRDWNEQVIQPDEARTKSKLQCCLNSRLVFLGAFFFVQNFWKGVKSIRRWFSVLSLMIFSLSLLSMHSPDYLLWIFFFNVGFICLNKRKRGRKRRESQNISWTEFLSFETKGKAKMRES